MREDWQAEFARSYRNAKDLLEAGYIEDIDLPKYELLLGRYAFVLPRYYASLIEVKNPNCPIRLQAIPRLEELESDPNLVPDPLQDLFFKPTSGITHRYKNRVLFHLTTNCSMFCRFCFRKSLLNELSMEFLGRERKKAFEYIATETEIEEVIFSGGDPWMVSDSILKTTLERLDSIKHLKRIRFHTRVPVTFPMRVTEEFLNLLKISSKKIVVVCHFNHQKELTLEATNCTHEIRKSGFTLLNQAVLLRNVNDSVEELKALCERLFQYGILPYYLHHPDQAQGTRHFQLGIERGRSLYNQLRKELSGYLVPRYVMDDGSKDYKKNISI